MRHTLTAQQIQKSKNLNKIETRERERESSTVFCVECKGSNRTNEVHFRVSTFRHRISCQLRPRPISKTATSRRILQTPQRDEIKECAFCIFSVCVRNAIVGVSAPLIRHAFMLYSVEKYKYTSEMIVLTLWVFRFSFLSSIERAIYTCVAPRLLASTPWAGGWSGECRYKYRNISL